MRNSWFFAGAVPVAVFAVLVLFAEACSSTAPTGGGAGGSAPRGTGGSTVSSGGTFGSSGGSVGSGGSAVTPGTGGGSGGQLGSATGGAAVGTGGTVPDGGAAGVPGSGGQFVPPDGGANPDAGSASVVFVPSRAAISGVRGTSTPPASQTLQLHNGGTSAAQVTRLALGGTHMALFHVTSPTQFPATIAPGGDLAVTLQMDTGATLPPPPANKDMGVTFLTASLTATVGGTSLQIPVFGLAALQANYEATFGQILIALGYPMNVGKAQNNWNWNNPNPPTSLGGVKPGTDEVAAPLFVKAGPGNVTMVPMARFSPEGEMPFGWYPPGMPTMRTRVAALAQITDPQTSNKARMVYPPLVAPGNTSFDPGAAPFGVWAYTGQAVAGTVHGDYNYSQDAFNLPAPGIHRVKVFTFKDATGAVPNTFLLGFEEASNGDYQDYVILLSNVKIAP